MIEIGGKPILWHIMKIYSKYAINEFVVCCGYKGYLIKEYFANYFLHMSDVSIDMNNNSMKVHQQKAEPWKITLVDTGDSTMTGGRLKRVAEFVKDDELFLMTYGDGLSDVNMSDLISFHQTNNVMATLTAVHPPARFGALKMSGSRVQSFIEKPVGEGGLINGGFFVLSPKIFQFIDGDTTVWEKEPLERLANQNELAAFTHTGFWQPMDTLRDKQHLEELWNSGNAPWLVWR